MSFLDTPLLFVWVKIGEKVSRKYERLYGLYFYFLFFEILQRKIENAENRNFLFLAFSVFSL
jgi:hypothetical protein